MWLFLRDQAHIGSRRLSVLHFAPEPPIARRLESLDELSYTTADIDPGAAGEQMDITAIPRPDATFDLILVSHVLEHVPEDDAAMAELYRVLRPGAR
jgi:SAM-dependent methyltransferase